VNGAVFGTKEHVWFYVLQIKTTWCPLNVVHFACSTWVPSVHCLTNKFLSWISFAANFRFFIFMFQISGIVHVFILSFLLPQNPQCPDVLFPCVMYSPGFIHEQTKVHTFKLKKANGFQLVFALRVRHRISRPWPIFWLLFPSHLLLPCVLSLQSPKKVI